MAPDTDSVERLEVLLAEQSALRRVATLVAADPDPGRLFECVCRELGGVLGVESTDALRYAHDGSSASIVGGWALRGSPSFPVGTSVPVDGETVAAKLYRSGRPERVDDYSEVGGELATRLREFGIRSAVGAPVKVAGRLWGAIMAVDARPYAFPEGTEQRIANFAELVTAALANADARDQLAASRARILAAGYEERRRLERDLHDGAQQEFVSAALSLRLARQRWSRDPDEGLRLLDQASDQLQAGLRDLRELAAGIHPSVLTDRGLGAALQALATRAAVPVELGGSARRAAPGGGRDDGLLRRRRGAHEREQARSRPRRRDRCSGGGGLGDRGDSRRWCRRCRSLRRYGAARPGRPRQRARRPARRREPARQGHHDHGADPAVRVCHTSHRSAASSRGQQQSDNLARDLARCSGLASVVVAPPHPSSRPAKRRGRHDPRRMQAGRRRQKGRVPGLC